MRRIPQTFPGRIPGQALLVTAVLLGTPALSAPASAQAPAAPAPPKAATTKPRRVDARTDEIMRRMSAFLAQAQRFALEADESFDEVSDNAPRLQLTNVRRMAVVRPNRMATDATGDTLNRVALYDGRSVSVLDKAHNAYVTIDAPATIDAMLDALEDKLGVVLPLGDFAYSDPYAVLMEGVLYGEYRGLHLAGGVPCHHLAFTQEEIEWQVWIDAGDEPLPRKLLIAYVDEPGVPQYSATIRRWTLKPAFTDELFKFEAPEDAMRIELGEIPGTTSNAPAPEARKQEEKR